MICIPCQIAGDQTEEGEMGSGRHSKEMHAEFWWGNLQE
jgi:hypothetical protein